MSEEPKSSTEAKIALFSNLLAMALMIPLAWYIKHHYQAPLADWLGSLFH